MWCWCKVFSVSTAAQGSLVRMIRRSIQTPRLRAACVAVGALLSPRLADA